MAVGGRVGYAVATPEGMPVTRHLVFVASVLLLSLPVAAQPDNKPVPVSKEVRAAWEKKGMVTGWVADKRGKSSLIEAYKVVRI